MYRVASTGQRQAVNQEATGRRPVVGPVVVGGQWQVGSSMRLIVGTHSEAASSRRPIVGGQWRPLVGGFDSAGGARGVVAGARHAVGDRSVLRLQVRGEWSAASKRRLRPGALLQAACSRR